MSYEYSFDSRGAGSRWFRKSTYEFLQKGLVRLRDLLDEWNRREVQPPYSDEAADLTRMIEWGAQRLVGMTAEHRDVWVNDISIGSFRYPKAGAVVHVLQH